MRSPHRSNCLVWAVARWLRKGGYVAFRRSNAVPFKLHFLHSTRGHHWWSYIPVEPRHGATALLHGLWFRGHVVLEEPRKLTP